MRYKSISFEDYAKDNGDIDWRSYKAAKVRNGELCCRCEGYAGFFPTGQQRLCRDCIDLDEETDEVTTSDRVRCPYCRHIHTLQDLDDYSIYEDGDHEFGCDECGKDFSVETNVSYSFTSPALIDEDETP